MLLKAFETDIQPCLPLKKMLSGQYYIKPPWVKAWLQHDLNSAAAVRIHFYKQLSLDSSSQSCF